MKIFAPPLFQRGISTLVMIIIASFAFAYDPETDKVPYYLTPAELDEALEVETDVDRPSDYARALYFHRTPGCSTCRLMSKYVYETIKTRLSNEVKSRKVVLSFHNIDDVRNAKLVETFKIGSPTLVIVQGKDGKDVKAKKADKIWSLVGDKEAFMKYVESEIRVQLPQEPRKNATPSSGDKD